ncbi:MAG TPA: efflux RND transporter periplasmic adaptor subunit [bacterium]|nr:efflux RND transporter periplasmic adaptor subunit [bacterium]
MKKTNLSKIIKEIVLIIIIALGIFFYFKRKTSITAAVRKVQVQNREVSRTVSASGVVKPKDYADLSFLANGNIVKINVEENDVVKKGQLLAYLDASYQKGIVQSYKDARDIKMRERDIFVKDKPKNEKLLGGETLYEMRLRGYNEAVSQAEASYQAQLAILSNYYIYAPFDGTIISVQKKEGETAIAGSPIITMANLDQVEFEVVLDQEDFGNVKEGMDAEIELDAYEGKTFKGKVSSLPLYADPTKGGFVVKSLFDNDKNLIKVGMTGEVNIITDRTEGEVPSLIFNEISYDEDSKPYVWIAESGKIRKFPIEIGLEGDLYTEVKTDLTGKTVVVPAVERVEVKEGFIPKIIN